MCLRLHSHWCRVPNYDTEWRQHLAELLDLPLPTIPLGSLEAEMQQAGGEAGEAAEFMPLTLAMSPNGSPPPALPLALTLQPGSVSVSLNGTEQRDAAAAQPAVAMTPSGAGSMLRPPAPVSGNKTKDCPH